MKENLTSFDIAVITREIGTECLGYYIDNVYQVNPGTLLLKLNRPGHQPRQLILAAGRSAHITKYEIPKPKEPPSFALALRKYLKNATITNVTQPDFERIIEFTIEKGPLKTLLIVELFPRGNIILTDENRTILQASTYKKMKDRNILRGEKLRNPVAVGKNPFGLSNESVKALCKSDEQIVKVMARGMSIGGQYAEEILTSANIDKKRKASELSVSDYDAIYQELRQFLEKTQNAEPTAVINDEGDIIDYAPFLVPSFLNKKTVRKNSVNEILDEIFAKTQLQTQEQREKEAFERQVNEFRRILQEQNEQIAKLEKETNQNRSIATLIQANVVEIGQIVDFIKDCRLAGKSWDSIEAEIKKRKNQNSLMRFESINPVEQTAKIRLGDIDIQIDPKQTVYENASAYFDLAKAAKEKVVSIRKAIEETQKKIGTTEAKAAAIGPKKLEIVREKRWFEKFNYFDSSEEFLVVAGKDASSNEALLKRYSDSADIVFHADFPGAPFAIIKTNGKQAGDITIREAAQFAACHSRAWRENLRAADVYWVNRDQVSKSAPSGEYLTKGAFMVYGNRNYLKNTILELAIGLTLQDNKIKVTAGPPTAVATKSNIYAVLEPGSTEARKIAEALTRQFLSKIDKQRMLPKEISSQIMAAIPFGKANIHTAIRTGIPNYG